MLKDWLKRRTGRFWPWVAFPVRVLRVLLHALADLPRMLSWDRVRATRAFARRWRRELAVERGRLTVAVDVTPYWEKLTGVGWYLHQILSHLGADDSVRLHLYGPTVFVHPHDAPPAVPLPAGRSLRRVTVPVPEDVLFAGVVIRVLRWLEPWIVARQGHDVVFAPNFLVPRSLRRSDGALVVTVHDLGLRRVPWSLDDRTRAALERGLERSLARAAAVITPSRAVADEVVEAALARAGAVTPIHHGPGQLATAVFVPLPASAPERYALFVGTLEPRKNLELLLDVWPRLWAEQADAPVLVVCGGWGWKSERVRERIERAAAEGWLIHLGYVEDAPLAALYRGALLLVFPSLYEGFGLPLLEAMAAGCPVLCSDLAVFREVADVAAEYASPGDAAAWLAALQRLVADPARRAALARAGLDRAGSFGWNRAARETLDVWRAAAASATRVGNARRGEPAPRGAA